MAVRLDITTNVKGQSQVDRLKTGLNKLATNAAIAGKRLKNLELAAARSRAQFTALGTALKVGAVAGAGALAYLASKKGSDSDGSVDVAQVARDMRKAEIEGLMDDYNREHGTDIGQRKNKSYRRERGLPEN